MELAIWAALYANREMLCEYAGIDKDTSDIDAAVRSELITVPDYFRWLFQRNWVPDSHKVRVAEVETLKYEKYWGIDLDKPEFSVNGWLIYSHTLQSDILWPNFGGEMGKEVPEKYRKLFVLTARQQAKNEGRILVAGSSKEYIDMVEVLRNEVFDLKKFNQIEEVYDLSSLKEVKEEIDKLFPREEKKESDAKEVNL